MVHLRLTMHTFDAGTIERQVDMPFEPFIHKSMSSHPHQRDTVSTHVLLGCNASEACDGHDISLMLPAQTKLLFSALEWSLPHSRSQIQKKKKNLASAKLKK